MKALNLVSDPNEGAYRLMDGTMSNASHGETGARATYTDHWSEDLSTVMVVCSCGNFRTFSSRLSTAVNRWSEHVVPVPSHRETGLVLENAS